MTLRQALIFHRLIYSRMQHEIDEGIKSEAEYWRLRYANDNLATPSSKSGTRAASDKDNVAARNKSDESAPPPADSPNIPTIPHDIPK